MSEYDKMVTRQRKWMLYLLAIFVIGLGFSSYNQVFNGLLLGGVVSFYNLWLLQHKTKALGKAVADTGKVRGGLGTFSRLASTILAVLIALRFNETFHIIAVVFGIISSYIVIGLDISIRLIADKEKRN
ncbi:ATP synthase subunit I [Oceanobacillus rekensis]|uniref:ATP synthase subunit I n=1 Tax=Oceanobacillus rekensis TaxID=937927 RepID=UPI000B442D88|nr:ATP synthase subunit I [Oceanobacillus rekensis]